MMSRKPSNAGDQLDDFIKGAKDTKLEVQEKKSNSTEELNLEALLSVKTKTFPLNMPPVLHKMAADKASKQFPKVSLHDYILLAIKEKIESK